METFKRIDLAIINLLTVQFPRVIMIAGAGLFFVSNILIAFLNYLLLCLIINYAGIDSFDPFATSELLNQATSQLLIPGGILIISTILLFLYKRFRKGIIYAIGNLLLLLSVLLFVLILLHLGILSFTTSIWNGVLSFIFVLFCLICFFFLGNLDITSVKALGSTVISLVTMASLGLSILLGILGLMHGDDLIDKLNWLQDSLNLAS